MYKANLVLRVGPAILLVVLLTWGSAWIISSALQRHLDLAVACIGVSTFLFATCWPVRRTALGGGVWGAGILSGTVGLLLLLQGGLYWQAFADFCVLISLSVASYLIGLLWSVRHLSKGEQVLLLQRLADNLRRDRFRR